MTRALHSKSLRDRCHNLYITSVILQFIEHKRSPAESGHRDTADSGRWILTTKTSTDIVHLRDKAKETREELKGIRDDVKVVEKLIKVTMADPEKTRRSLETSPPIYNPSATSGETENEQSIMAGKNRISELNWRFQIMPTYRRLCAVPRLCLLAHCPRGVAPRTCAQQVQAMSGELVTGRKAWQV